MFTKKRLELLKELREYFKEEELYITGVIFSDILKQEEKDKKEKKLIRKINKKEE